MSAKLWAETKQKILKAEPICNLPDLQQASYEMEALRVMASLEVRRGHVIDVSDMKWSTWVWKGVEKS